MAEEAFVINNGILEQYLLKEETVVVPEGVHTIGSGTFKACVSICRVILPQSLTTIGAYAFKGCRRLEEINFPNALAAVGKYAFHRCHNLKAALLPWALKELGECAFLYCDRLEVVSIPGVTRLGRQCFLNDTEIKKLCLSAELDITTICDVFTGCYRIKEISLSDGALYQTGNILECRLQAMDIHPIIQEIATDVFRMMDLEKGMVTKFRTNLRHVEIPEGVTSIGKSCFFDKKGIISVSLPQSLKKIGRRAFRNCINLKQLALESENIEIDGEAFKNCTTLKEIAVKGKLYSLEGLPKSRESDIPGAVQEIHKQLLGNFLIVGTALMKYRGEEERVTIPEGVEVIGEGAFAGNQSIDRIILPESIREIHPYAFADCPLLQVINLPAGLRVLGASAFINCVKLIRVKLPQALTMLEPDVFNRCKKLREVEFAPDLNEISQRAFYLCESLDNIQFPPNLMAIGDLAFYKCRSLKKLELPQSIKKLGNNVFTACGIRSLKVYCVLENCGTDVFSQCNKLWEINFADRVRHIPNKFAFSCNSLQSVQFSPHLINIGRQAFEGSPFWDNLPDILDENGIYLKGARLSGEVIIPEGIKAIAGGAFCGNNNITSVVLPESVKYIGARAFYGCASLKSAVLPENIPVLEEGAFAYCETLENVVIQSGLNACEQHLSDSIGLQVIGDQTFYGCKNLREIPLSQVKYIGNSAFGNCTSLQEVDLNNPLILERAFAGTLVLKTAQNHSGLAIMAGTVIDGSNARGELRIPQGIVAIAPYAFSNNDEITGISLPESLRFIGEGAFYACPALQAFKQSKTLQFIGKEAFARCTSLKEAEVDCVEIEERVFANCTCLEKVSINGSESLSAAMFYGCSSLKQFTGKNTTVIEDACFSGCENLISFDFSSLTYVGQNAFCSCNSLEYAGFNKTVSLKDYAFKNCGKLRHIDIPGEITLGSRSFSGCTALNEITVQNQEYLISGYKSCFEEHLPDIVKTIYFSALSCFDIDENLNLMAYSGNGRYIHIPDGIKTINTEIFMNMLQLEEIKVPQSVTNIGARAFFGTKWLGEKQRQSPLVIINNILVDAAAAIGNVTIPPVDMVAGWAFANCMGLNAISFTSERTILGEFAFRNCINLKSITTPQKDTYFLTCLGDRERENLPEMVKRIIMECYNCFKTDNNGCLLESTGNIAELNFPAGIRSIEERVFYESNLLTVITLSTDTTLIKQSAFEQCKWLRSVRNAVNVVEIGKKAFSGCGLLEEIELSHKLKDIGVGAFEHCTSLKHILIPEGVTEIPERAFYRCKNLAAVTLPSTLERIGKEAFALCTSLRKINKPYNLQKVDTRAFAWCPSLNERIEWTDAFGKASFEDIIL